MGKSFFNGTEAELYTGTLNFSTKISAAPTGYGLTVAQAGSYATLSSNYRTAYQLAINPDTHTKGTVAAKNAAKKSLKATASDLAKIVDATPSVTNQQKIDLGLSVRKTPAPIPAPTTSPKIDIISTNGRTVTLRLHNADSTKRARPAGTDGASVFSYVGETPPADTAAWKFEFNTAKTVCDVVFPTSVPNGATAWLTAFWIGSRMESGPACNPVSVFVPGGMTMAA